MSARRWSNDPRAARRVAATLACALAGASAAAAPATRQAIYVDESTRDAPWHQGWADAVVAGDLVFASGIVAGLDEGEGDADAEAAFSRAFDALDAVLRRAGADLDDVVELTIYLTDIDRQLEPLTRARLRHMRPPYAASTVVQVERQIPARSLGEIRAVARR